MYASVASISATEVAAGAGRLFVFPFGIDVPEGIQAVKTRLKARITVIRVANDLFMGLPV